MYDFFLFYYYTLSTAWKIKLRAENTAEMLSLKAVHHSQQRQSVLLTMLTKHVSWLHGVSSHRCIAVSPQTIIAEKS